MYKDKTSVGEVHALMAEKLELSAEAALNYALFEKTEDGNY
jgi:anionic cell wall polymer biosynthesis LytR-Cps2A-Psr (LCP) family protein